MAAGNVLLTSSAAVRLFCDVFDNFNYFRRHTVVVVRDVYFTTFTKKCENMPENMRYLLRSHVRNKPPSLVVLFNSSAVTC